MYQLTITHNSTNKVNVDISFQEYKLIMKILLTTALYPDFPHDDIQTKVREDAELAQKDLDNGFVP